MIFFTWSNCRRYTSIVFLISPWAGQDKPLNKISTCLGINERGTTEIYLISLYHLLKLKAIPNVVKSCLVLTQRTWTVIFQLSFTLKCVISSVLQINSCWTWVCAFLIIDLWFRIFLLKVINFSTELSFSHLREAY